ncbi:hypothetical protein CFC21_077823 [Triticum aestivum]|uniref:Transmembrane protein n=4 Tax=Triticinae TaxID=1648030 RepID=A0A9R1KTH1_WHEAT|nr:uncharacterized protein LOC109773880 [Aegilops tauschii subsp. strangulata]XP_037438006.1 uncharacterized protein LOC119305639 [Triticum dicoccoides]XP_044393166.1 uncharacterized protein LOC123116249 [Triticum aestivum]XP_044401350.1 uncharacterized protein LOC123124871 [Triticum aestivum]VAI32928.1 unnamed protein product [Triticum turgidum subsp. durum]KAF7065767.1 hypothetical protein CFC21_071840 [Triticum aestivum]KAF7072732.1 hypothetical protein CFC21_077823 [Triticum aestivum]
MGNSYSNGGSSSGHLQAPELPLHLCFFLLVLFVFLGFSWYMSYESVAETFADQGKLLLMVSPLALLLAVRLLSGGDGDGRRVDQLMSMSMPERDSIHRAGGSPWGVGLLLVLLIVMVSYQSNFRERWFAL